MIKKLILDLKKNIIIDEMSFSLEKKEGYLSINLELYGYFITVHERERTLYLDLDYDITNVLKIHHKPISNGKKYFEYLSLYNKYLRINKINRLLNG